jgi:hypothetical protein
MLGAAYEAGWGVTPDPMEALYWYSRSLDGDAVELREQDMAFQPKIAIESLRRRLPPEDIRLVDARLRKDRATDHAGPQKSAKPMEKPSNIPPVALSKAAAPQLTSSDKRAEQDGLPQDALTRPQP